MNSSRLLSTIKYLLYAITLTPLIVTPFTVFPFNFGRGLAIQLLIEIIFGLYIVLATFDKQYRPKKNPFIILLGLFLAVLFISSVFGADFHRSFWSNEQRFTGWLYLLHIFLFFIVIVSVFKSKKDWNSFLGLNVWVAIFMFAIAILGIFGIKFWGVDLGTRISGTIGNPIFLGTYFILNLIFGLYLFSSAKDKKSKVLWLIFVFILFLGVILTRSMGALAGTTGGIVIGFAYYAFFDKRKKVRIAVFAMFFLAIFLVSSIFILKGNRLIYKNKILSRISGISISLGTGNTRFINWQSAWSAIKEQPILGWGMESGKIALNKYYNPQLLKYSYYETWPDKPHNKILEIGIDAGFIGIFIYLSIFLYSSFIIWQKRKKQELSLATATILTGGLGAYFIQNLLIFDTTVSYLLFFILLGLILFKKEEQAQSSFKKIPPLFLMISLIIAITIGWFVNISPILASTKLRSTIPLLDIRQKADLSGYKEAMKYFNPYKKEWQTDLVKSVISSLRRESHTYNNEEIQFALRECEKYAEDHPNSAYSHLLLAIFYNEIGIKDKKYFDLAKAELDRALELSPKRQHIYFAYARLYGLKKDKDRMIDIFKRAIDSEPNASVSYWEASKQLYLVDPQDPLVKKWQIKAAELRYNPVDRNEFMFFFSSIHDYFLEQKNYEILSDIYARIQDFEPNVAKWRAQSGMALYLYTKNNTSLLATQIEENNILIIKQIKKAIELDESYREEGEEFIRLIEAEE